jgi:hypothetical protein
MNAGRAPGASCPCWVLDISVQIIIGRSLKIVSSSTPSAGDQPITSSSLLLHLHTLATGRAISRLLPPLTTAAHVSPVINVHSNMSITCSPPPAAGGIAKVQGQPQPLAAASKPGLLADKRRAARQWGAGLVALLVAIFATGVALPRAPEGMAYYWPALGESGIGLRKLGELVAMAAGVAAAVTGFQELVLRRLVSGGRRTKTEKVLLRGWAALDGTF